MEKKQFGSTLLTLSLAFMLSGCSAQLETEAGEWLNVAVQARQSVTKISLADDGSTSFFAFEKGDQIGFFAEGIINNAKLTCTDGAGGFFNGKVLIINEEQAKPRPSVDYYAYYPYNASAGKDPTALKGILPSTQKAPYDDHADYLVANPITDVYDIDAFPSLSFDFDTHLFALVKLNVTNSNDAYAGEKILSIGLQSDHTPLAGQFTFSAVDGEVDFSDNPDLLSNNVSIEFATPPTLGTGTTHSVYAIVNAATYASGTLKLVVSTTNYVFTIPSKQAIDLKSYRMTSLNTADIASATRRNLVRTILLWGDSISCAYLYYDWMRNSLGSSWKVIRGAVGGDSAIQIAGRQGGLPVFTENAPITLPASSNTWVDIDNLYVRNGTEGSYTYSKLLTQQTFSYYHNLNPIIINGIPCEVGESTDAYHYHIRRVTDGDETVIPAMSPVSTYGARAYADAEVVVCYAGTNGNPPTEELIEILDRMAAILTNPDATFIVLGFHQNTTIYPKYWSEAYVSKMSTHYGRRFIDLRTEGNVNAVRLMKLIGQITDESEISEQDVSFIEAGNWPYSWHKASNDGIHMSQYGSKVMGELLYERMEELDLL